ncbi:MAG TPA: 4-alpha-glucanotransferase [Thermoflexales bacterium]|nr:4-alpha-glucanotransferase [Thermoflexales bacterium]
MRRTSGVLLHPTSLPGRYGIGEFSDEAYRFVDWLVSAGQTLWQVMPLGPTGYGDSPYQCFSAFAGNPLLIGLDALARDGALSAADLANTPVFPDEKVDFGPVIEYKKAILRKSYDRFATSARAAERQDFARFCAENATWLDDYALFIAIKDAHNGNVWNTWESDIARHEPAALRAWRAQLADAIEAQQYYQYQFFRQWAALRAYANERGVRIVGDIPIFVAFDSADAWSHRDEFHFDEALQPTVIAGVPPDYFSPTGQRWGNPLYRWDVMQGRGFDWWIERCKAAFGLYDVLRIDHFRGFESYWEVPASEPTAMIGHWVSGPGLALFQAIERALGALPIIAEDLGVITPEVEALRDACGFPGMRVMQFAFVADTASAFLPHNFIPNTVAYVGTHDNDTTLGWWATLDDATRAQVTHYTGTDGSDIAWDLIRTLSVSVASTVVFTLQDLMGLGAEARMNLPGRAGGNWGWRFTPQMLSADIARRLEVLARTYGRGP